MTEDEYINTANLAKLRVVDRTLRDVLPHGPVADDEWRAVIRQVQVWTMALEAIQNEQAP